MNFILACTHAGIIGNNNSLPWEHLAEDMAWFKQHTAGHVTVMGRKTWESIGSKPLPGRPSVVISKSKVSADATIHNWSDTKGLVSQIKQASMAILPDKEPFVIGGKMLFDLLLPYATKLYVTTIFHDYPGDSRIDLFKYLDNTELEDYHVVKATDTKPAMHFGVYSKKN